MKIGYDLEKISEQRRLERDGYIAAVALATGFFLQYNPIWLAGSATMAVLALTNRFLRDKSKKGGEE